MARLSTGTAGAGYFAERSRFGSAAAASAATFPQNAVLDSFVRINEGPPMTGWADNDAGFKVVSNQAAGNDAFNVSRYTAAGTFTNAEAFATIAVKPTTNGNGVAVLARLSPGAFYDHYGFFATLQAGTDTLALWKSVGSAYTKISVDVSQEFNVGDKIGIKVVGTTISGWFFTAGSWSKVAEVTDSSVSAAGHIGMACDLTVSRMVDFGGGTAT